MSRWGQKTVVVPLDSLCKEKENTDRVARSVGTVGKWGKMGFTSTRTYALSALPAAVAANLHPAGQSPTSPMDDEHNSAIAEPPKPKKFFKSRNAAPPEVIAQIIQNLPRAPTSPTREFASTSGASLSTPVLLREPIKLKLPKSNSAERKKKTPKKTPNTPKPVTTGTTEDGVESTSTSKVTPEPKSKKKKEEKKLKPEAAPSRIISRARKTVNYCEDDDEERLSTPIKDIIALSEKEASGIDANLPPPAIAQAAATANAASNAAPKTPEHPPIVLRISKGTSRLVSTDSEEQQASSSPREENETSVAALASIDHLKPRHSSTEEVPATAPVVPTTPKIIVKPPKPPSPEPVAPEPAILNYDDAPEFNYCTVKISPDKPPKERLKLIIKTDVLRNAIAAAKAAEKSAAAAASATNAAAGANSGVTDSERPEKEKKAKAKKHKHPKHNAAVEHLAPTQPSTAGNSAAAVAEFKTPSPHISLSTSVPGEQHVNIATRTVISPPATSERDFDSQSSVLGSISSKGNSTPQPPVQLTQEESRVLHSRGSSVITSDLETSQHSSLVAPPSDIESRLESMMMDTEASQQLPPVANAMEQDTPLQKEDIIAVLRGDEEPAQIVPNKIEETSVQPSGVPNEDTEVAETEKRTPKRRGRGRAAAAKTTQAANEDESPTEVVSKPQTTTRTRGRKPANAAAAASVAVAPTAIEETPLPKRTTRRGAKKAEDDSSAMEVDEERQKSATAKMVATDTNAAGADDKRLSPNKSEEENTTPVSQLQAQAPATMTTRRGRVTRNMTINNSLSNNNNNINKIAANLSAKAGAAEAEAAKTAASTSPQNNAASTALAAQSRSYGRKRKNQQVTQVLQPSAEELEGQQQKQPPPAKIPNLDLTNSVSETAAAMHTAVATRLSSNETQPRVPTLDVHDANSNSNSTVTRATNSTVVSPPRRDYKFKDKFKRELTLDNPVETAANSQNMLSAASTDAGEDEEQQRGSVKLVISKKKGSIFKSRALVQSDLAAEQAAMKRHLYKHSWDAEANGPPPNEGSKAAAATTTTTTSAAAKSSDVPPVQKTTTRSAVENIYDDFGEDLSATRDNSPGISKLNRVTKPNPQVSGASSSGHHAFEMDVDTFAPSENANVKTDQKAKGFYTVVRNVKTAHQIQEIGEYQEMDDDVEYILDALQPHNPTPTRCLSALQLATKCMTPAFRMHVRAHSVVTKFFKALSDANNDLSLGLCTSAIMFILSQEGLNMDLDRDSLELMMNLLESESIAEPSDPANYKRNKQKVRELCEEIKAQGKATHLNVDSITVGTLAMETLLSLTSKRAGEWFKEELRELGGLEHIIKTISECCRPVFEQHNNEESTINWSQSLLDNMQTVERCMRVLENVTQMNEENQRYMLTYAQGAAVNTLCTLYNLCDRELMLYPTTELSRDNPGVVMRELLMPVMKVLINLTHTFNPAKAIGAEMLGKRNDVINVSFHLLLQAPNYIPDRCIFELSILVLLLLINLSMYTVSNRAAIMKTHVSPEFGSQQLDGDGKISAIQAIMEYFYKCEELARLVEKNTDAFLDNQEKTKKKQEEVDETVNNLLQKAGHHMEHTLKGSYAGILIGHLITDSEEYESIVRTHLHGNGFKEIVGALEKYYTFMNLTASSEASVVAHIKSTKKLIDYFKKRDLVYEMNDSNNCALPLNLETRHTRHAPAATTTNTTETKSNAVTAATAIEAAATTKSAATAVVETATSQATATSTRTTPRMYKTYSQR